ncbi:prephenate dehydratase [Salinisphaera orenii]|uniref:prephenate dehydratase n=1 Tax=Salinisphaera orenii TaxID=856731 RepID=UPI000DBEA9C2
MNDNTGNKMIAAREAIDEIDRRLQSLIAERAGWAEEVGRIKQIDGRADFYRPGREAEILRQVAAGSHKPLSAPAMTRIMREIMAACRALEQPLAVAYLGPEGTYTEAAVYDHFGQSVSARPQESIEQIFREVAADNADFGVAPIENSTQGVVSSTLDQMVDSRLSICGEIRLGIHHQLLSRAASLDDIHEIQGHGQALGQCGEWLGVHMPNVVRRSVSSNGAAARAAAGDDSIAAIAGHSAGAAYGLDALARNIENDPDNTTRFLVLGKQNVARTGCDTTSIMVAIKNRPGTLYRLLAPAADAGVDLARIESRPSQRGTWDYNFFIDLQGHTDDDAIQRTLTAIESEAVLLKVLGSYPRAVGESDG